MASEVINRIQGILYIEVFMKILPVSFEGKPANYAIIDEYVSRSAQPKKDDFLWLKKQGVTDVFNFRTMIVPDVNFNEEDVVKKLGMRYHNIPSITKHPKEENVDIFLREIDEITKSGGKAHIHCKAGADRTGMYSYIYKSVKSIGSRLGNQIEMLRMGHSLELYPELLPWTNNFINKLLALKK